jgi:predicted  nucleic acid-binding Zn-ribbon protein
MDKAALLANGKERKRLEEQIQVQNQKVSKLRDQMLAAKNNDQYKAFQNEIEFCELDVRKHEDRILELMAESDPLEKNVRAAEKALAEEKTQVDAEKAEAREKTAADEKALAELKARHTQIAAEISADVLKEYERLRKARRGIAVAEVNDGRCTACHIGVRPQFMQELRRGDQVKYCESCGRILVYNPPQSVEELVGQRATEA